MGECELRVYVLGCVVVSRGGLEDSGGYVLCIFPLVYIFSVCGKGGIDVQDGFVRGRVGRGGAGRGGTNDRDENVCLRWIRYIGWMLGDGFLVRRTLEMSWASDRGDLMKAHKCQ